MPNSCNLNLYRNGSEAVEWHSDGEELFGYEGEELTIVTVTLGASIFFRFTRSQAKEIIQDVEAELIKIEELQSVYLRAGTEWWRSGSDKVGSGFVEIVPTAQRDISGLEVMQMVT